MSDQQKQQQFDGDEDKEKEEDIRSIEGSEWSVEEEENIVGHGNAKLKEEINPKIALLEAKNQILEGKLENLELKAQIRTMTEEDNLNKLKEENKAIWARMEAAEEKAQMAKNEVDLTIKGIQQKMDESVKEMANKLAANNQEMQKKVDNQLKTELQRIQKHGTGNFVVTNENFETEALIALMPNSVNIQPIRKRIQLILKNCRELFKEDEFRVESAPIELIGFEWHFAATTKEKGFLALYLHAKPPNGFNGNYRIHADCRFSILNAFTGKDLIKEYNGKVYTKNENNYTGWGFPGMAKFEDLLDTNKTFLTPEGDLQIWADFTIKSSTLNNLTSADK